MNTLKALPILLLASFNTTAATLDVLTLEPNPDTSGNHYRITQCDPTATGELILPADGWVDGKRVNSIANQAFTNCINLTHIELPDTITEIQGFATFLGCSNLLYCRLPEPLTTLPNFLFTDCVNLKHVDFSSKLYKIGQYAFYNTALETFTCPPSLSLIDWHAFTRCQQLKEINFNTTIYALEHRAYSNLPRLEKITLPPNIAKIDFKSFIDCSNLTTVVLQGSAPVVEADSFQNCHPDLTFYVLQKHLESYHNAGAWNPDYVTHFGFPDWTPHTNRLFTVDNPFLTLDETLTLSTTNQQSHLPLPLTAHWNHQLESTPSLTNPDWQPLTPPTTHTNTLTQTLHNQINTTQTTLFIRVQAYSTLY